jgi:hypothetical protein
MTYIAALAAPIEVHKEATEKSKDPNALKYKPMT